MLLLGGGGYTIRNVARCWTYETSVALNCDIANGESAVRTVLTLKKPQLKEVETMYMCRWH